MLKERFQFFHMNHSFRKIRPLRIGAKKLHEKNGESITEVLAASLIIALGLTMMASMVSASFNMLKSSSAFQDSFYASKNQYENGTMEDYETGPDISVEFPKSDESDHYVKDFILGGKWKVNKDGQVKIYGYENN